MKVDSKMILFIKLLIPLSILIATGNANVTGTEGSAVASQEQGRTSMAHDGKCLQELTNLLNNATGSQVTALNSFGIPNTGLLSGNRGWYGHFHGCAYLPDFKYCLLTTDVNAAELPSGTKVQEIGIRWGVCVPEICTAEEIGDNVNMFTEYLSSSNGVELSGVSAIAHCIEDNPVPYTTGFYITVGVFGVIGLLMILGTVVDVIDDVESDAKQTRGAAEADETLPLTTPAKNVSEGKVRASEGKGGQTVEGQNISLIKGTLLAFAINRNLSKLTAVGGTGSGDIGCLHGIRVIAILWIITMHVFTKTGTDVDLYNHQEMRRMGNTTIYQIVVLNASTIVDIFLFLSGLLVCNSTLRKLDKNEGSLCWPLFYLHRYIRLTPILAAVIALWVFVSPHTYWGPTMGSLTDRTNCERHWWIDLLYIQNFVDKVLVDQCLNVAWYLSVDMQLFVVSPFITYTLYRSPAFGIILTCIVQIISFIITGVIVATYNMPASTTAGMMMFGFGYGDIIYDKPYIRIPPYLVGMVVGFIIYKYKDLEIILSKYVAVIGWFVAISTAAAVLGVTVNHHYKDHSIGKVGDVAYQVLHRFAWGVFLSWVVIYCHFGKSGWINNFLSWNAWVPLSRLTYIVYLIHVMIYRTFLSNFGQPFYTTALIEIFNCVSIACVSYICAVFLYLVVELPVANLEQAFLPRV